MQSTILFISGAEIIIIILVALLLFGSKKVPEIARELGRGLREFKKVSEEIRNEIVDVNNIVSENPAPQTNSVDTKKTETETETDLPLNTAPTIDDSIKNVPDINDGSQITTH